ncbi:MAG: beta-ketoacyl-ACP synthase II [Thermomicrobiales bacterium]
MSENKRIVITGIGAVTPIGNDPESFWANLVAGKSGAAPITSFDTSDLPVTFACEVKDFDPSTYIDSKAVRRMDRFSQFAVVASGQALDNAGIKIDEELAERTAIVMNTGGGGVPTMVNEVRAYDNKGPRRVSPFFIPVFAPNMAAAQVSLTFGITGPVMASVAACAAGAQALVDGYHTLQRGDADIVIAGGTEAALTQVSVAAFANMQALSRRNDCPEKASRPFDADRDGFVFAEGCGALILEREEDARARGATILCELAGGALTADAFHITAPEPEGRSVTRAIRMALEKSDMSATDVDSVYAHATSTPIGDIAETKAIKQALGDHAYKIGVCSPKSQLGHLVGAAGAVSAVAAVLSLRDQVMAPTINLETPDPECDLDYIPNKAREMKLDAILSNSFGFGGQNVVCAFKRM